MKCKINTYYSWAEEGKKTVGGDSGIFKLSGLVVWQFGGGGLFIFIFLIIINQISRASLDIWGSGGKI
jgi:hypothetical protein